MLSTGPRRDLFLKVLEEVRRSYGFVVVGYVVMPEHVHLLISEPEHENPSVVMQVLKQESAKRILRSLREEANPLQSLLWGSALDRSHVWQACFYDFNAWSEHKRIEKLRYIHRNPVQRGLVLEPEQWAWSSFRYYALGEPGLVLVNEQRLAMMKLRSTQAIRAS